MDQIKNLLPKSQPQPESSEEILTPEEIESVLRTAREIKQAEINTIAYNKKLKEEAYERSVDPNKFMHWIIQKAKVEIRDFKLSDKEMELYKDLALYFTQDERFEVKEGYSLRKGLWLFGDVGCGKTSIMELFSENPLRSYPVVECIKIADSYKQKDIGVEIIHKCSSLESVCFNDLGTEIESGESSYFGNKKNVIGEIVLNHYELNKDKIFRYHFTTNLGADKVEELYGKRVRSRLREMCNIFSLEGINDKRK
jgi:DNA replication protein DnaC